MIPRSPFLRSLAFAVAAGLACWLLAPALVIGCFGSTAGAVRLLIVLGAAAQLAVTAASHRRGLVAAALCGGICFTLFVLPLSVARTAVLSAAVFGACRSGLLYRQRAARAVAVEALLLVSGLALASFLAGPGGHSLPMAFWGFWLVQSAYFALGGVAPRRDEPAPSDPFDRARARILALLDP